MGKYILVECMVSVGKYLIFLLLVSIGVCQQALQSWLSSEETSEHVLAMW